ncbi:ABC transporter substrate-binding protein [Verrucosispora sp. WMMA2044]|uniref:Amino acid ABC transporter substrate-binding protein n=1 Tax=Verrucosispora sioxanthis TaxID=2499994 RepID=A0A6M1KV33_9ACTN|nr:MULTISPECIES: ABC transporter substrate-binding protein [Micromonospora]NEE62102.1 amino acid ABC transporter substrate-binding protein [Verrucosispora sioxanthis]NGM11212.1 amino acid ABC transporter substrate-binding protein [Verrucosispora sioxanthis]WBB46443.1 ABC transporter substrate-binding protein [Verrucosispora sp. WMMA2044]
MVTTPRTLAFASAAAVLLAASACTPQAQPAPMPTVSMACVKDSLPTQTPGKLTIATGEPADEPWFVDDKPANGKGFESAVAYAVAEQLGYARDDVTWTRVASDAAVAPGPKTFDFGIDRYSMTEEHKQAVDFSAPYHLVRQAVVALESSKIADRKALAELRDARLGAQADTTSHQAITDLLRPSSEPRTYKSRDEAAKALRSGRIDGLVVDLPTAFDLTGGKIDDAVIVGQLPQVGSPEAFGLLLAKDSPLAGCVSAAVGRLASDGVLEELEQQWLTQTAKAPNLT